MWSSAARFFSLLQPRVRDPAPSTVRVQWPPDSPHPLKRSPTYVCLAKRGLQSDWSQGGLPLSHSWLLEQPIRYRAKLRPVIGRQSLVNREDQRDKFVLCSGRKGLRHPNQTCPLVFLLTGSRRVHSDLCCRSAEVPG